MGMDYCARPCSCSTPHRVREQIQGSSRQEKRWVVRVPANLAQAVREAARVAIRAAAKAGVRVRAARRMEDMEVRAATARAITKAISAVGTQEILLGQTRRPGVPSEMR